MPNEDKKPEWIAEVFPDWTTLQIIENGMAFAFNRATGRVYKLPSDECPFVQLKPMPPNAKIQRAR